MIWNGFIEWEGDLIQRLTQISPELAEWVRHDDFGRVFGRAGLSLIEREAIVLGALIAQGAPQISFHSQALLRVGGDEALVDTLLNAVSGISVRVHDLQRPEGRFDGIAHSLRRAPADGELVLNIGNGQAASASL